MSCAALNRFHSSSSTSREARPAAFHSVIRSRKRFAVGAPLGRRRDLLGLAGELGLHLSDDPALLLDLREVGSTPGVELPPSLGELAPQLGVGLAVDAADRLPLLDDRAETLAGRLPAFALGELLGLGDERPFLVRGGLSRGEFSAFFAASRSPTLPRTSSSRAISESRSPIAAADGMTSWSLRAASPTADGSLASDLARPSSSATSASSSAYRRVVELDAVVRSTGMPRPDHPLTVGGAQIDGAVVVDAAPIATHCRASSHGRLCVSARVDSQAHNRFVHTSQARYSRISGPARAHGTTSVRLGAGMTMTHRSAHPSNDTSAAARGARRTGMSEATVVAAADLPARADLAGRVRCRHGVLRCARRRGRRRLGETAQGPLTTWLVRNAGCRVRRRVPRLPDLPVAGPQPALLASSSSASGNLGQALAGYGGFGTRGFRVAGLVDADRSRVGSVIAGIEVRHVDELESIIADHGGVDRRHRNAGDGGARRLRPAGPGRRHERSQLRSRRPHGSRRRRRPQGGSVDRAADPCLPRAAQVLVGQEATA